MNRKDRIVVWYCVIVMILILGILYLLTGCSANKAMKAEMIWIEGSDCTFIAEGLSAEKASEISKEWKFGECGVEVTTDQAGGVDET